MLNKKVFLQGVSLIQIATGKTFTEEQLKLYPMLLEDLNDDEFIQGIKKMLKERVYTNIPAPAEIINYCIPKKNIEVEAIKASEIIRKMVREGCRLGNVDFTVEDPVIVEVIKNLGGLKNLSRMSITEYNFALNKKIPELYKTLAEDSRGGETKVSIRHENMGNIEVKEVFVGTNEVKLLLN